MGYASHGHGYDSQHYYCAQQVYQVVAGHDASLSVSDPIMLLAIRPLAPPRRVNAPVTDVLNYVLNCLPVS